MNQTFRATATIVIYIMLRKEYTRDVRVICYAVGQSVFSDLMPLPARSSNDCYFIAEVGQNHQGSIEEALKYITVFSAIGANCIKFQIRNNKKLFDSSIYNMAYESTNSFGETYGEHREALELSFDDYQRIKNCCKNNNVDLCITPFDEDSLVKCIDLDVDIIKIASFDLGNLPFLVKIAKTGKAIVMSSGGGSIKQIEDSVKAIYEINNDLVLLHCVSKYPCSASELNLLKIKRLRSIFPDIQIGLSDHFNGILSGPLAYTQGARVFEKHVTFDRSAKGTDHPFSLEPDGFRRFIRDTKRVEAMMRDDEGADLGKEPVFQKLGKSIVAARDIPCGSTVSFDDLTGIIVRPTVVPVRESARFIGAKAKINISKGTLVNVADFEDAAY